MFVYGIAQEGDVCLLGLIRCTCETNQIVNLDKNTSATAGIFKLTWCIDNCTTQAWSQINTV